ncbi:MAG: hypothetical protein KF878_06990 [Planctomycetes bacterium]|nr:hypothetical protein [Planctomycetota bacterium]
MNVVHVLGTGTIGEPLIAMLARNRDALGIDEVTFHKRTPIAEEKGKLDALIRAGARLATDADRWAEFHALGHAPRLEAQEAIDRATVVVDCTPAGLENKRRWYERAQGPRGFLAQGSEHGFGKPYARGVNDRALVPGEDRFLHVVSCNTHNIAALVRALALDADGRAHLEDARFVCMRRANDVSQDEEFVAAPTIGKHDDARFGTHHAHDAHGLFATLGLDLPLWSSVVKMPTQYMHTLWFSLTLDEAITLDEVKARLRQNPYVALTRKRSANRVFSFGRDHGLYGRILSQTVVPVDSLAVRGGREVVGACFTPQDGNSLLSSVAATLWLIDPETYERRVAALDPFLFSEV